jgi:DNA (cytosine-5)-methyltransferase 1
MSIRALAMASPGNTGPVGLNGMVAPVNNPAAPEVISLFSGAMGLDLGLEAAGLSVKVGQDVEPDCVATMQANGLNVLGGDIREISTTDILEAAKLKAGQPFLVCGGPPCQPFSTAGKRLGINDPRGSLFMDFIRVIREARPRFFVMENVKGLMSAPLVAESGERGGKVLDVVLEQFDALGYRTVYGILDAVNYGVPQFRERFILVGSRDGEDIFLPLPTNFQTHQDPGSRWRTLRQAIGDLEDVVSESAHFSEERLRFLRLVPEGGNWRSLPEELIEQAMGGAYGSSGGKVGFYRRLSFAEPSPTLVTSPVQKATMMGHPTRLRPLSVAEYARIQQFPDDWHFAGNTASKYRQIGNAVPIGLGRALGQMLLAVADGTASVQTKRFRGTAVHDKIRSAMELGVQHSHQ